MLSLSELTNKVNTARTQQAAKKAEEKKTYDLLQTELTEYILHKWQEKVKRAREAGRDSTFLASFSLDANFRSFELSEPVGFLLFGKNWRDPSEWWMREYGIECAYNKLKHQFGENVQIYRNNPKEGEPKYVVKLKLLKVAPKPVKKVTTSPKKVTASK